MEQEWGEIPEAEVMCGSNLSYLIAYPVLGAFHLSLNQPGCLSFSTATNPDCGPSDKE